MRAEVLAIADRHGRQACGGRERKQRATTLGVARTRAGHHTSRVARSHTTHQMQFDESRHGAPAEAAHGLPRLNTALISIAQKGASAREDQKYCMQLPLILFRESLLDKFAIFGIDRNFDSWEAFLVYP